MFAIESHFHFNYKHFIWHLRCLFSSVQMEMINYAWMNRLKSDYWSLIVNLSCDSTGEWARKRFLHEHCSLNSLYYQCIRVFSDYLIAYISGEINKNDYYRIHSHSLGLWLKIIFHWRKHSHCAFTLHDRLIYGNPCNLEIWPVEFWFAITVEKLQLNA